MVLRRSLLVRLGGLGFACQHPSVSASWFDTPTWADIKLKIRATYPDLPQMTVAALQRALREEPRHVLLDARARAEFDISHLAEASWTPDLATAVARLAALGKDTFIVVYCSVGWRSAGVAQQLLQRGYTRVFNLEGSLFEWANAGLPVYQDGRVVKQVHPYNARWGALLLSPLRATL